jgi:hypothetical protein
MQKNKTMKKIIILILISTISCTKGQDKSENHLRSLHLLGDIKSIVETTYQATVKFGEPVKTNNVYDKKELLFNDSGYKSVDKKKYSTIYYEYDNHNNLLVETKKDSDGNQMMKFINKYNDNDKLIEVETFGNGEDLFEKSKYEYEGNKRISNSYDKEGEFNSRWVDVLNEKNSVIQSFNYDKNGQLKLEWKFNFDERGNKTQDVLVKSPYPSQNQIEIKEYNEKNEIIKISIYNYENTPVSNFTFKYKYDEKNNWINKIMYNQEGSAIQITERNITYK